MIDREGYQLARPAKVVGGGGGTTTVRNPGLPVANSHVPAGGIVELLSQSGGTWKVAAPSGNNLSAEVIAYAKDDIGKLYSGSITGTNIVTPTDTSHTITTGLSVAAYWDDSRDPISTHKARYNCSATVSTAGGPVTLASGSGDTLPGTGISQITNVVLGVDGSGYVQLDWFQIAQLRIVDTPSRSLARGDRCGTLKNSFGFTYQRGAPWALLTRKTVIVAPTAVSPIIGGTIGTPCKVAITGQPSPGATVRVTATPSDTSHVHVSVSGTGSGSTSCYIDFTPSAWTPLPIYVYALSGATGPYTITLSVSIQAGSDWEYAAVPPCVITVTPVAAPTSGVALSALAITNGVGTYTIAQAATGQSARTITFTLPLGVSVSPSSVSLAASTTTAHTITVTVTPTGIPGAPVRTVAIKHTDSLGSTVPDLTVVVTENNPAYLGYIRWVGQEAL